MQVKDTTFDNENIYNDFPAPVTKIPNSEFDHNLKYPGNLYI